MHRQIFILVSLLLMVIIPSQLLLSEAQSVTFCRPTNGRITDEFGTPRDGNKWHFGLDIAGRDRKPVYSIGNGVVIDNWRTSSVHSVTVRLDRRVNGKIVWVRYLHMDNITVERGDRVRIGERLGDKSGAIGFAPHLHIEIIMDRSIRWELYRERNPVEENTGWVNPARWIQSGTAETCSRLYRGTPTSTPRPTNTPPVVPTTTSTLTPTNTPTVVPTATPTNTPLPTLTPTPAPNSVQVCARDGAISRLTSDWAGYGWHAEYFPFNVNFPPRCPPAYWTRPAYPNAIDWIEWYFSPPTTGNWTVRVYIPSLMNSPIYNTRSARYQIAHAGGTAVVTVDQQSNLGNEVVLGTYRFVTGNVYTVRLNDYTGDSRDLIDITIAADVVVWTYMGQ